MRSLLLAERGAWRAVPALLVLATLLPCAQPLRAQSSRAQSRDAAVDQTAPADEEEEPEPIAKGSGVLEPGQIEPPSPVNGGNDPNRSDDTLYILQTNDDDFDEVARAARARTIRPHVFLGPSARLAAKKILSPRVSVEAFATAGLSNFQQGLQPFEPRDSNASGGVTSTADLGFVNGVFAYEHKDAFQRAFAAWKSNGDRVGATFNKTLPFFVPKLTVTPQLIASREIANPIGGSDSTIEPSTGFTYTSSPKLSFAFSIGYSFITKFGLPGDRHDNGLKLNLGATYKVSDKLIVTVGATTNRTLQYGFPQLRTNNTLGPNVTVRYNFTKDVSISLTTNYARFLTTLPGDSTFKYNFNPVLAITVPL